MSELSTVQGAALERTPQRIGEEIRSLTYQAKCMTVYFGVEIGRRLVEAKELVGHGGWGDWVKNETEFSQTTASRFMKVFEAYGADQIGIFGAETKSSTLQNLSISNALRLLAVPEEEREAFAAEVDAEHISARELEKVIRERDEARASERTAEKKLSDAAAEKKAMADSVEKLKKAAKSGDKQERERLAGEVERLKKELALANTGLATFKAKLEGMNAAFSGVNQALAALEPDVRPKMVAALRAQFAAWEKELEGKT